MIRRVPKNEQKLLFWLIVVSSQRCIVVAFMLVPVHIYIYIKTHRCTYLCLLLYLYVHLYLHSHRDSQLYFSFAFV